MGLKVFLVEDFDGMRSLLAEVFSMLHHVRLVSTAGTAREAMAWLDGNPDGWDVLIVDLVLEQGSGMEVIRQRGRPRVMARSSYSAAS